MTTDKFLRFQMSKNLKNGEKNFSYQKLEEDLNIMDTNIIGSHFSLYKETIDDAFHLWLLDYNYEDFLNNHADFLKD